MAGEFIKRDGKIIVNCDAMEAYIPLDLFDEDRVSMDIVHAAVASAFGDGFKVVGVFNVRCANGVDAEKTVSTAPLKTFIYPNIIETYPSSFSDKELQLTPQDEPEKYLVFKYTRGDIMMDAEIKKDADNCTKFLDILNKGKLPNTISYPEVYNAWIRNIEINDGKTGVTYMQLQYIISCIYKMKKDISKPFRMEYGKDMSSNDYYTSNIRGSVATSSIFANQTFEHMSRMLTNAVNITRRGLPQEQSPIEKVLYM